MEEVDARAKENNGPWTRLKQFLIVLFSHQTYIELADEFQAAADEQRRVKQQITQESSHTTDNSELPLCKQTQ